MFRRIDTTSELETHLGISADVSAGIGSFSGSASFDFAKDCWGEVFGDVFGDDVVAAAMIDRLVHHAEVITLKETATEAKSATSAAHPRPQPSLRNNHQPPPQGVSFQPCRQGVKIQTPTGESDCATTR